MRIGIVGSRKFKNKLLVKDVIDAFLMICKDTTLISGGCKNSPDEWAEMLAKEYDIPIKVFLPKYPETKYYFARNKLIAENSDFLIAFIPYNLLRSGAWNTVKWMKQKERQNSYIVLDEEGKKWDR